MFIFSLWLFLAHSALSRDYKVNFLLRDANSAAGVASQTYLISVQGETGLWSNVETITNTFTSKNTWFYHTISSFDVGDAQILKLSSDNSDDNVRFTKIGVDGTFYNTS